MSQQDLADRVGLSRNAMQNIESPRGRTSSINVLTLVEVAWALDVPPVALLYPTLPDGPIDIVPGVSVPATEAVMWFSGERPRLPQLRPKRGDDDAEWQDLADRKTALQNGVQAVDLSRRRAQLKARIVTNMEVLEGITESDGPRKADMVLDRIARFRNEIADIEDRLRAIPESVVSDG